MARHKKHHHEEHIDETWLIPYADLLTLLLALFIVLFASSNVDQAKMDAVSESLQEAFHEGGAGVLDGGTTIDEKNLLEEPSGSSPDEKDQIEELTKGLKAEFERLEKIKQSIDRYIKEQGMEHSFSTAINKKGLLITIQDAIFFESGSAELKPESIVIANSLSDILAKEEKRDVVISGHTDNIPIRNGKYRSNWDLSAMRGINFLQTLLQNNQLDPTYFSVSGYGEYHPISDNNTATGREKNRRVEILILPNTNK